MVHKDFIGMYETTSTTGENLARIILAVLLRLNLPISGLRGQAYEWGFKYVLKVLRCQPRLLFSEHSH